MNKCCIFFLLVLTAGNLVSCRDDAEGLATDVTGSIQGRWNSYESGTAETGFVAQVETNLTIAYESGITFLGDGTFKTRHHNAGTWSESDVAIGTYELKGKSLTLIFFPGTTDEYKVDIELVKLDDQHLWFRHSIFVEKEYHLVRVD